MLLIKQIEAIRAKAAFAFALMFICHFCPAQLNVVDSVIHYAKSKISSYTYTTTFYSGMGNVETNYGEIIMHRHKAGVEYRITDKKYGLDFIKSKSYIGYNNFSDTMFMDYSKDPSELVERTLDYVQYEVLYPDSLANWFKNPSRHIVTFRESKEHYFFDLKLARPEMTGDSLALIHSSSTHLVILKKNYRVCSFAFRDSVTLGGVDMVDSSRTTYTYGNVNEKEVLKKINGFVPFKKREPYDLEMPKDTATIFPPFQLPDTTGKDYNWAQCKSKLILVEFWYKSCAPCLANIKQLKEVRSAFGKERVEILAINDTDPYSKELRDFLKKYKINFNVLFNAQALKQRLQIRAHPMTYIFEAKTGKILYRHTGGGGEYAHEISDTLHRLLGD